MHILFLTDNFPPETNAPASRTYEHARIWVASGHQVTVVTCTPNFPEGIVHEGYKNKPWQSEIVDGIRVIRVWTLIAKNEGFGIRILDYLSFMVSAFFASFFVKKPDIVVGTSPQFFTACSAWAVAACKRRPFVFELRDIWPESLKAVNATHNETLLNFFERVELFLYRRAAAIVSVTHSFKQNLISRNIAGDKIHVVTNGVDHDQYKPAAKNNIYLHDLNLEGKFVVGYIGTHGMAHALHTVLDTAKLLENSDLKDRVRFLLIGNGARKEELKQRVNDEGLTNITMLDGVPKHEVRDYWSLLDASIIHLRRDDLFKQVIPSKLFECMSMGIPVLHGVEGESATIVSENSVGLLFEPENPKALADAITQLFEDEKLRKMLAANGIEGAKRFDRTMLAGEMLEHLKNTRSKKTR